MVQSLSLTFGTRLSTSGTRSTEREVPRVRSAATVLAASPEVTSGAGRAAALRLPDAELVSSGARETAGQDADADSECGGDRCRHEGESSSAERSVGKAVSASGIASGHGIPNIGGKKTPST